MSEDNGLTNSSQNAFRCDCSILLNPVVESSEQPLQRRQGNSAQHVTAMNQGAQVQAYLLALDQHRALMVAASHQDVV